MSLQKANCIMTRLIGGLGNQMFQYAAGRALSLRAGAALKVDRSGFDSYKLHHYSLGALPIQAATATAADLAEFAPAVEPTPSWRDRWRSRLGGKARIDKPRPYRERHFHFDAAVTELRPPVYLVGYWQSERYFLDYAATVRRELTPVAPLEPENEAIAARIDAANAVSVHVRRGDYVSDPNTNRVHGSCSQDYYRRAVDYVSARAGSPHLFVFSDDQQWARRNLRLGFPATFVETNSPARNYRDMQLMARCRHHIIANSSFSWWGAWMNPSNDKIVVAPERWFNVDMHDTRDLIPDGWVRV
jgi:Glycosyl transferase family 11